MFAKKANEDMDQHRQKNSLKSQGSQHTENTAISKWVCHHFMASHIHSITQFTTKLHIMQHHQHHLNRTMGSLPVILWYHRRFQPKMCNLITISILTTLMELIYPLAAIYNRCVLAGIQSSKILEINLTFAIRHSSLI